jgi:anti-sigma regulatory factor (Ser/Thr protein kinase)
MAESPPNVRLDLAGTPENVVLVRETLSGVAEALSFGGSELNDIRTAVTEACNNVVVHAYGGGSGPLEIEICIQPHALHALVRDHGNGISTQQAEAAEDTTLGIGFHVIQTLTDRVHFEKVPGGGTEVRMEFATPSSKLLQSTLNESPRLPTLALAGSPATVTVSIAPIGLARTILPRLAIALAARAHFSTDRISDVQLLADTLVAYAQEAVSGEHISVGVNVEPRDLELHIAPLDIVHAQRLIGGSEVDGGSKVENLGGVIQTLTDRRELASLGPYEALTLGLIDRR